MRRSETVSSFAKASADKKNKKIKSKELRHIGTQAHRNPET